LDFLDVISNEAAASGAAPYLSKQERISMGMSRPDEISTGVGPQNGLKYEAYVQQSPEPVPAGDSNALRPQMDDLFGGLQLDDNGRPGESMTDHPTSSTSETSLQVHRQGHQRRWGPAAQSSPISRLDDLHSASTHYTPDSQQARPRREPATVQSRLIDPAQEQLAESLFGPQSGSAPSAGIRQPSLFQSPTVEPRPVNDMDLLGDLDVPPAQPSEQPPFPAATQSNTDIMDLLGGGEPIQDQIRTEEQDGMFENLFGGTNEQSNTTADPQPNSNVDPFQNLLD